MSRRFAFLLLGGTLAAAAPAGAACGRFGSQVDCSFGAAQLIIGTQVAADPSHGAWEFRPHSFQAGDRLVDASAVADGRFRFLVQDFGTDARRCRRIGNEDYCY